MKKSTQKMLMALGIIVIFGLSSIAFVFSGFAPADQQNNLKPLDKFVVDGEIDPRLEDAYTRAGFTFLKLYYSNETARQIIAFAEQAPDSFTTPDGQRQLIVIKLQSSLNYAKINNLNGERDIFNVTTDKITEELCTYLVVQPTECALAALNLSS